MDVEGQNYLKAMGLFSIVYDDGARQLSGRGHDVAHILLPQLDKGFVPDQVLEIPAGGGRIAATIGPGDHVTLVMKGTPHHLAIWRVKSATPDPSMETGSQIAKRALRNLQKT